MNHAALAGLAVDIVGAAFLLKGLALESPERYVRERPSGTFLGAVRPSVDLARAAEGAEARVGALLLAVGFAGQFVGVLTESVCWLLAWGLAAVVLGVASALLRVWKRRRERAIFLAQVEFLENSRRTVREQYGAEMTQRGRVSEFEGWIGAAERRLGASSDDLWQDRLR